MRHRKLSNLALGLGALKAFLLSHTAWILGVSILLLLFDSRESLFGFEPHEALAANFALSPGALFRFYSIPLFTYPLLHVGWEHWASSAFFWLLFAFPLAARMPGKGFTKEALLLAGYAMASATIGLTYLLPFAPASSGVDRVLGLSALALFQVGALLPLKPPLYVWVALPVLAVAFVAAGPGSAHSLWGHGAGFVLGLSCSLPARWFFARATVTSA